MSEIHRCMLLCQDAAGLLLAIGEVCPGGRRARSAGGPFCEAVFWGIWPILPSPASRCQLNGVLGLHLAEDTTLSLRDVCFLVLIWLVRCVPGSSGARPQGAPPTQPGPQPLRSAVGGAGVLRSAGRGLGSGHSRPWLPTAPC